MTHPHTLRTALGLTLGLLVLLMANGIIAGVAAVASGEVVLK
ncbi:hypothetical protein [Pelagerythrobacter aerophilus]|nr:hypothetical protein [Pelagerythrobacter aerophilus]